MSNEEQRLSIIDFIESKVEAFGKCGYQVTPQLEGDLRHCMTMLAEFIMNKYNLNPLFPGNTTEPKGFQRALYAVTAELKALRETINDAAERIAPSPKYVQLNPQGRVVDGTPVLPAPRPVLIHRGETYYFAGEYARNYPSDGEIYVTYAYKLKKKGG